MAVGGIDEGEVLKVGTSDAAVPVAVAAWVRRSPALATEAWCAAFPYDTVAEHWHRRGRSRVGSAAIGAVDEASALLAADDHSAGAGAPSWTWFLRTWLPMLVDIGHGRCTYATYVGTPTLAQWPDHEAVVALLLAQLLRRECTAAPVQVSRVAAVADSLARHPGPYGAHDAALLWEVLRARRGMRRRLRTVVDSAHRLADAVLDAAPPALARQVGLLALPMTTVREEHLFLRVLQLFETVFAAMLTEVEVARLLLAEDDLEGGAAALDAAAARLGRSTPFFRILGTMQPAQFALIREETPGASGLQSTSFKGIELACARRGAERLASPGYAEPVVAALVDVEAARPTIEEHATRLGSPPPLVVAMQALEHRWGQWKKAHWATASRLIGPVPGTGGTDGAAYLRAHLDGPLFPSFWSAGHAL